MTLSLSQEITIKAEDFNPPLKRKEAAVPGYWTVDELAEELGVTTRYINYLIKGNDKARVKARLKAYKTRSTYLVADPDALDYLWKVRQAQK
jgi:predicted transcriptional regulator